MADSSLLPFEEKSGIHLVGSGNPTDRALSALDALDRTVSETENHSGTIVTTSTVYQGDSSAVYRETLTGAQSELKTYTYDANGNAATLIDNGTRYSYVYDPGSSVSVLIDRDRVVKESYGYSAYGNSNASISKKASGFSTGTAPVNPVRFQGKRFDSGSGGYDMGARRYSPSTGRWLQQDMYYGALDNLGLSQDPLTANRYAFLGANPVNYVEVDGHKGLCNKFHFGFAKSACKEASSVVRAEARLLIPDGSKRCVAAGCGKLRDYQRAALTRREGRDIQKTGRFMKETATHTTVSGCVGVSGGFIKGGFREVCAGANYRSVFATSTTGRGKQSPALGVYLGASISNAHDPSELKGRSGYAGASVSSPYIKGANGGVTYFSGKSGNRIVRGVTVSQGWGPSLGWNKWGGEVHKGKSKTRVWKHNLW